VRGLVALIASSANPSPGTPAADLPGTGAPGGGGGAEAKNSPISGEMPSEERAEWPSVNKNR